MDPLEQVVSEYFAAYPTVQAVYVYGSVATESAGAESDVDLGILCPFEHRIDGWSRLQMAEDLAERLGHPVDLVDLTEASPILGMQVLRKGRLIYCRDMRFVHNFFVRTVNQYADLKQVRRTVEENLGKVTVL